VLGRRFTHIYQHILSLSDILLEFRVLSGLWDCFLPFNSGFRPLSLFSCWLLLRLLFHSGQIALRFIWTHASFGSFLERTLVPLLSQILVDLRLDAFKPFGALFSLFGLVVLVFSDSLQAAGEDVVTLHILFIGHLNRLLI
jgi:hypothetical protein